MPGTAIWSGRLLVLIGIIGYAWGLYSSAASPTALIPAGFGIVLMLLGHVSLAKPDLRKHLMHVAVLLGVVGFLAATVSIFRKGMPTGVSAGVLSQVAMAVVCLVFVIFCVRSFIAARREGMV
jgi:hypothetical protein